MSEEDVVRLEDVRKPAYGLLSSGPAQSQCSGGDKNAFCFMCAFESATDGEECSDGSSDTVNDHPAALRSLVRALVNQKRETYQIIRRVYDAYDKNVRPDVVWTRPDGKTIYNPEWTIDSIKTHLLSAPEFHDVFLDCVENVFTNIVMAQNSVLINEDTGHADPDAVEAFLKTVKAMCAYKESRARLSKYGGGAIQGHHLAGKRSK